MKNSVALNADPRYIAPHYGTAVPDYREIRACSSAGEHFVDIEGVTGSIPVTPTIVTLNEGFRKRGLI